MNSFGRASPFLVLFSFPFLIPEFRFFEIRDSLDFLCELCVLSIRRERKKLNFAKLVGSSGLEPPTSRLSGVRSNHLSYEPI